ncbi:MAG: DUF4855 domain-containing protein [Bacteroidetes bacterium]|nr:DUF4855 domain-containing protein [Bacteroidota bacterium]
MKKFLTLFSFLSILAASLTIAALPAFASEPAPAPPKGMVDLILGKSYTAIPLVPIKYSFAPMEAGHQIPGSLTDGRIASSTNFNDREWQWYIRGGSRSIVIDMGSVNTVRQMQERFLHDPPEGIYFPRKVGYALSMDGKHWADVGTVRSAISLTRTTPDVQTYALRGLNYRARYVKIIFTVDVFALADEFQVFGNRGIVDHATFPKITPPPVYPDAYCPPGSPEVGGTRNMVLIANGYYKKDPAIEKNSVDQLLPYVGYMTPSGKITDFMFDSFLFSAFGGAPSGGQYGADIKKPTVESDWVYYINNTFIPDYNLSALDIATGKVKKILGKPSYKSKVEIAIPYPTPSATQFGNIDGAPANLSYLSDRERVVRWYVDKVLKKWKAAHFRNLKLVGFYWISEKAAYSIDDSETAMLRYVGHYVRSVGKVLDWIPFINAEGFTEWHSLGFDGAEMQPNYSFHNFPPQELGEAADACKKLGMGIEIEIHWDALKVDSLREKYYQYLNWGIKKGYMTGAAHSYYQNAGPGTFYQCCYSKNPKFREIYDKTYDFIKGTYTPTNVK